MPRNPKAPAGAAPAPGPIARSPLERSVRIDTIRDGQEKVLRATDGELQAIAALQDLRSLNSLILTYRLYKAPGGSVRLKGVVEAEAVQTCVVTLEPVEASVKTPVEAEFWPPTRIEAIEREQPDSGPASDPLADWPEPIVNGTIDPGTLAYETFALALDPYPRCKGAYLPREPEEGVEEASDEGRQNPFAALAQLKRD